MTTSSAQPHRPARLTPDRLRGLGVTPAAPARLNAGFRRFVLIELTLVQETLA